MPKLSISLSPETYEKLLDRVEQAAKTQAKQKVSLSSVLAAHLNYAYDKPIAEVIT